jgi:polyhydroxyalkanoate synthesis repressor PhaR
MADPRIGLLLLGDHTMARKSAQAAAQDHSGGAKSTVRVLKKYPNRRLYDTKTSSYITLADVKGMVMAGEDFEVRDAKSSEDLTRSILLQIILEEEAGGQPLFSTPMLGQIIRFYGHAMQGAMGTFMEQNLLGFVEMQERMLGSSRNLFDASAYTPGAWAKMFQAPAAAGMPDLMGAYMEQSKAAMAQLQEQMQRGLFPGFPPKS